MTCLLGTSSSKTFMVRHKARVYTSPIFLLTYELRSMYFHSIVIFPFDIVILSNYSYNAFARVYICRLNQKKIYIRYLATVNIQGVPTGRSDLFCLYLFN
jgi:hypothetical protein